MTSSQTNSGAGRPPRKRQFPFGLVMLIFGAGLGFYGGIAATRQAIKSPPWIQKIFGVTAPTSIPVVPASASVPAAAPLASQQTPASTPAAAPSAPDTAATTPSTDLNEGSAKSDKSTTKKHAADGKELVGSWTITDNLARDATTPTSLTTTYAFRSDYTGEFASNGKKLYDFHWTPSGDEISVEFDGEGPDASQPWTAKLKWSLNDDKTLLTLIPSSGKDPRSFVYSLGPGVYHKKG